MASTLRALPFRLGLCLLAALLSGCGVMPWLAKEKDPTPPTKLQDLVQQVGISKLWSERPTHGTDGRRLYLVPVLAGGKIYVADDRGRLVALAPDSGRELWRKDTKYAFSGGPAVSGDKIVLGTSQGDLIALSAQDGHELWHSRLESEVLSVPQLTADGKVIVHTLDDTIYGIDATTGKELWRISYPAPVLTLRGSSTPLIVPKATIVGLSGGKLVKIDTDDGVPQWEVIVTRPSGRSELARIADVDADPILKDDTLYVGTYNGDLAAVSATTGTVEWRRELSAHAGLAADASGLYITDSQDQVWGANLSDGAGRWKQDGLRYRQLTAPALVGSYIAVGDYNGYLHLLNKADGRLVGRVRIAKKSGITARPVVEGNRVYVYAEDGTVAALGIGAPTGAKARSSTTAKKTSPRELPEDNEQTPEGSGRLKLPR